MCDSGTLWFIFRTVAVVVVVVIFGGIGRRTKRKFSSDTHQKARKNTASAKCACNVCLSAHLDRDMRVHSRGSSLLRRNRRSTISLDQSRSSGGDRLPEIRSSRIYCREIFHCHVHLISSRGVSGMIHLPRPGEYPANRHTHPGITCSDLVNVTIAFAARYSLSNRMLLLLYYSL